MKKAFTGAAVILAMMLLIIDGKTAVYGGKEAVELCLYTIIPALFPFILLSDVLCRILIGVNVPMLRVFGRICKLPKGTESLLLIGFLGGYPVGAQNIATAYHRGAISKAQAHRMLGFCNNAGPAFIFGMIGFLFGKWYIPWLLWLIHMTSAIVVGILLPNKTQFAEKPVKGKKITQQKNPEKAIRIMASICGWVILFRVILAYLDKWIFDFLKPEIQVWITGLLELSNGLFALNRIESLGQRFVLCSAMLGFGGICVSMQTLSVTESIGTGDYFPGKLLQGLFSILLAYILQALVFHPSNVYTIHPVYFIIILLLVAFIFLILHKRKIIVENRHFI